MCIYCMYIYHRLWFHLKTHELQVTELLLNVRPENASRMVSMKCSKHFSETNLKPPSAEKNDMSAEFCKYTWTIHGCPLFSENLELPTLVPSPLTHWWQETNRSHANDSNGTRETSSWWGNPKSENRSEVFTDWTDNLHETMEEFETNVKYPWYGGSCKFSHHLCLGAPGCMILFQSFVPGKKKNYRNNGTMRSCYGNTSNNVEWWIPYFP